MKKTLAPVALALIFGSVTSVALAQSSTPTGTAGKDVKEMRGDMPDHPHDKPAPGSKKPMKKEAHEGRGDMPDHPHDKPTAASKKPIKKEMHEGRGDMPDHPHDTKK
ncbi:MAG: hypothetical protein ACOZB1_01680 [Pseudomonadota bacterium]|jgi:hypothetical protein